MTVKPIDNLNPGLILANILSSIVKEDDAPCSAIAHLATAILLLYDCCQQPLEMDAERSAVLNDYLAIARSLNSPNTNI